MKSTNLLIIAFISCIALSHADTISRVSTKAWPEKYENKLTIGNTLPNELQSIEEINVEPPDKVDKGAPDWFIRSEKNKLPKLKVEEVQFILSHYVIVSREEWLHTFHHVAGLDRIVELKFKNGDFAMLFIRTGGLAVLKFPDGSQISLTIARTINYSNSK